MRINPIILLRVGAPIAIFRINYLNPVIQASTVLYGVKKKLMSFREAAIK